MCCPIEPSVFNVIVPNADGAIIANTLTGEVALLDNSEASLLMYGDCSHSNSELSDMISSGFLCSKGEDVAIVKNALTAARSNRTTSTVTIACTMGCNFRCPYCWQSHGSAPMGSDVIEAVVSKLEETVSELSMSDDSPELSLCFTGGEPTLAPQVPEHIIPPIAQMCNQLGVALKTSMITNGYLLDSALAARLVALSPHWLLQVTLDGDAATHNQRRQLADGSATYDTIVKNIRALDCSAFDVRVRINVDKSNLNKASLAVQPIEGLPNVSWYAAPVTVEDLQGSEQRARCFRCPDEYAVMYRSMSKLGLVDDSVESLLEKGMTCSADSPLSFAVDPKGYLYKCFDEMGIPEKAFGKLGESWLRKENVIPYTERDPLTEPGCETCAVYPLCYGSCHQFWYKTGKHNCVAAHYLLKDSLRILALSQEECR